MSDIDYHNSISYSPKDENEMSLNIRSRSFDNSISYGYTDDSHYFKKK